MDPREGVGHIAYKGLLSLVVHQAELLSVSKEHGPYAPLNLPKQARYRPSLYPQDQLGR